MKTSLPIKSRPHQEKLQKISDIIVKKGNGKIAFVILFGSFARGDWVYDYYRENGSMYEYASDYDILIVTKTKGYATIKKAMRFKDQIHRALTKAGLDKKPLDKNHSTTLIVESVDKVNCELEKDRYFFADIKREGIVLYDSGEFELSEPRNLNAEERREIAREDYEHWLQRAEEFLITYNVLFSESRYTGAAFQLHQATESLYSCVLLTLTGYRPKLHDLVELNKLAAAQDPKFLKIFPKITKKPLVNKDGKHFLLDKEQLEELVQSKDKSDWYALLRAAYIEARYNKHYKITSEQLEYLVQKVEKLKALIEEICQGRI